MPEIKSNRTHTAALRHQSNRDRVDVAAVDGKIVRVPSIQCFPSKVHPPVHCITPLNNCRTGLAVGICSLQELSSGARPWEGKAVAFLESLHIHQVHKLPTEERVLENNWINPPAAEEQDQQPKSLTFVGPLTAAH